MKIVHIIKSNQQKVFLLVTLLVFFSSYFVDDLTSGKFI